MLPRYRIEPLCSLVRLIPPPAGLRESREGEFGRAMSSPPPVMAFRERTVAGKMMPVPSRGRTVLAGMTLRVELHRLLLGLHPNVAIVAFSYGPGGRDGGWGVRGSLLSAPTAPPAASGSRSTSAFPRAGGHTAVARLSPRCQGRRVNRHCTAPTESGVRSNRRECSCSERSGAWG